jgi:division protein CdvB (Snf7/Vps24/ESCRT-III family)|tara:strand:+ start:402 stop:1052 length:651 start_codon:yes stop_codon:yes gene_type:complete
MTSLSNRWSKPQQPGITERISSVIKPSGALKPRVETAIKKLQMQVTKLDVMLSSLNDRDQKIFGRIVTATQQHDTHTANVLSKELAEVRKVRRVLGNARMALEQIELRLTTFHDLGDTVLTVMPTIGLMKNMKSSLAKFMPGADQELNSMAEMLGGMMTETFHTSDASFGVDAVMDSESEKIMQEAGAVAEQQAGEKFPSMPTDTVESSPSSSRFM